ncbi:MAG: hypothetical protein U1E70_19095 [Acetobacteraceae bacterium]
MLWKRTAFAALFGAVLTAALATPASADATCAGTVSGSPLQALPRPTIVSVVQPVTDDANPGLAQEFLNALQAAGITVVPSGQGNTQLDMTFTVNAGPGATSGAFKGFGWMSGMQAPSGGASALPGSVVSISIEATNLGNQSLAWVGTIQCTIKTADPTALVADLGRVVAKALGRSMEQQAF